MNIEIVQPETEDAGVLETMYLYSVVKLPKFH